jgi:diguanylate cyclase (GGDEF)-like protein
MSSVILDIRTLTFVLMLVSAVLSLVMVFVWRTNKTYDGFGWWTIANLAGAFGFLLLGLRGDTPIFWTIVVANSFSVGCMAMSLEGIRRFLGRSGVPIFSVTVLILHAAALAYYTYAEPDVLARIYASSVLSVVLGARCIYEFITIPKNERLPSVTFTTTVFVIFTIFMLARIVLTHFFSHIEHFYSPDWVQSLTFLMLVTFVMTWTFNFLTLNSERSQHELKLAKVALEKLATTDFLTGLCNNRGFAEVSENEIRRARRFRNPLSVIMLDIDCFKEINDTYGHATGDLVLVKIAEIGIEGLRTIDTIGRLGGEEFGVLLPHTDIAGAETVAEFLRAKIEEAGIETSSGIIKFTASLGIAQMMQTDADIKSILERADHQLYAAKRNGRNQVAVEAYTDGLRLVSVG